MRRRKGIIGLALAITMAVTITACESSNGAKTSQTVDRAGGEEITELTWALWDYDQLPYYKPLIEAYEAKNPAIKIKPLDLGSSDYTTVLSTQLTGGDSTIDIATMKDIPSYATLIAKNQLESVDTSAIDLSGFEGITDQLLVKDELYALPFRNDFWLIFYNKDVFDAANVEYPDNDMTLEEYDILVRELTNDLMGLDKIWGSHYHTWRSTVQLFGILDGEHTIVDGNYEFLKPYYEMVLSQQKDGICQDYASLKTSNLHYSAAFYQNNVGTMNMGSWFVGTLIEKIGKGESDAANWGIVKYPHEEGIEPGTTISILTSLSISKASKHKEEAFDFLKFVSGAEGAEIIAQTGTFPAFKTDSVLDVITQIDGFPTDANSKDALHTAKTYLEMPIHDRSAELNVLLNDIHDDIMTGNISIGEGIKQMNEQTAPLIEKE